MTSSLVRVEELAGNLGGSTPTIDGADLKDSQSGVETTREVGRSLELVRHRTESGVGKVLLRSRPRVIPSSVSRLPPELRC